jgi:hypothetical protein
MSTPHCPVCGRWDGAHSGGCPETGKPYPGQHIPGCADWRGHGGNVCTIVVLGGPVTVTRPQKGR